MKRMPVLSLLDLRTLFAMRNTGNPRTPACVLVLGAVRPQEETMAARRGARPERHRHLQAIPPVEE